MNSLKRLLWIGSILSTLLALNGNAATVNIGEFTNFSLGNRWVYQQSAYAGLWTLEANSLTSRNGLEVILLQEYDSAGNKNDQHFYQKDLSAELRLAGGLNDFGQPTEETFFWAPSLPQLIETFTIGQAYAGTTTRTGFSGIVTYEYTFDFESITVLAGDFGDALRVTQKLFSPTVGLHQESLWFACGTGLVKRIQDDGNIWELSSFSGTTTECTPSSVPEPGTIFLLAIALVAMAVSRRRVVP